MRRFALVIFALLTPLQALALGPDDGYPDVKIETPLSGAELETVFKGKTHLGTYNFLTPNISTYSFEETTRANGSIRHVQQDQVDTGDWNITKNTICYDYDDIDLIQACFEIYARGNCYYHYLVSAQGFPQARFTARSVIAGETPNCEPSLV